MTIRTVRPAAAIGGSGASGLSIPGAHNLGRKRNDTLFLQNDSATNSSSLWYVTQVDATHYTMLNATAPKGWQYLGAFLVDGSTGVRGARANGAVWTISDTSIVKLISVSAAGQAAVSILKAGKCTLTVTLNNMTSTLVITAV